MTKKYRGIKRSELLRITKNGMSADAFGRKEQNLR
jgi:hypothetical protein